MAVRTLRERVTILQQKVEESASLPSRLSAVDLQIAQLRDEMRGEFSAVRQEIAGLRSEFRSELHTTAATLRKEIGDVHDEALRYMRVLHEEVLSRIAITREGRPVKRKD